MPEYYCDPDWHGGSNEPAIFRLRRPVLEEHIIKETLCCVADLGKAVAIMLTADETTTLHIDKIWKVNDALPINQREVCDVCGSPDCSAL